MLTDYLGFFGTLTALTVISVAMAKAGESLAARLGSSFGGGVLLGLVTALPETVLVVGALLLGQPGAAISSAVGANAMLMTLGVGLLGVVFLLRYAEPIYMTGNYSLELKFLAWPTLVVAALVLAEYAFVSVHAFLEVPLGIVLILMYFAYVYLSYKGRKPEAFEGHEVKTKTHTALALLLASGAAAVIVTPFFLHYTERVSLLIGVPYDLLIYVVTPIAAELEEKLSAYVMVFRSKLLGSPALYSFVGSKIENATVLIGLILLSSPKAVDYWPLLLVLIVSNLFGVAIMKDGKLSWAESTLGLVLYGVLTYFLYLMGVSLH
jgi:cation:H+ antiporter